MSKTQKEKLIVGLGLGLILVVGIITYVRSIPSKESSSKATQTQTKSYKKLSASELLKRINNKEQITIIDIRSDEAYINKHILDSIHITPSDIATNNDLHLPKTGQIILVAEDEDEASLSEAANQLKKKGIEKIYALTGGITMWESNGGQILSAGDPTIFTDQAKVKFISVDDLKNSIEENIYTIIDGRSKENFSQGHITGAISIPYEEIEREEIPTSKPIVTYDDNEVYGFQLGVRVNDLSLISPFVLRGGFKIWKEKRFPISQ